MGFLEKAIAIAAAAHEGQKDKAGAPYILHPLRVMMRMGSEEAMIAAVLHDVVEDSNITLDDLRGKGFGEEILTALDHLTKREGELYEGFIDRARENPLARAVKLVDLEDNMDMRRIEALGREDAERLMRYHRAWVALSRDA